MMSATAVSRPAAAGRFLRGRMAAPLLVLVIGLLCTTAATFQADRAIDAKDAVRFEYAAQQKLDAIRDRVENHRALLRGAAGLFATLPEVSRAQFAAYVARLRIPEVFPGVQGIGFSRRIPAEDLPAALAAARQDLGPDFAIRPPGPRAEYHTILFLEPQDRRNQAAIGYDMFTEPTRRAAMERARDTGRVAASGKVELVQEIDPVKQPGFLIYVPVYEGGDVPDTLEERRSRLLGFVYSPYRATDLFTALFRDDPDSELAFEVYDGDPEPANLLHSQGRRHAGPPSRSATMTVPIFGRPWTVKFYALPAFDRGSGRQLVSVIAIGGLVATLLLAGLAWSQAQATQAAVAAREDFRRLNARLEETVAERTRELEEAQARLLASNERLEAAVRERTAELRESNEEIQRYAYIVSHDLRAPLVNVMGFTSELEAIKGDLLKAGLDEAARARAAAEFDESIAFIKAATTKMDSLIGAILKISREGRRSFRPEPLDMTALVQGLADALRHQADAAGATILIEPLPPIEADRLAVEQVFSNLLDNAVKYLDPARPGVIKVTGRPEGTRIRYEVRDNGRGIPAQDHARVFELFRRSGPQDRPGEGIGLAHVKALVRSLGGRIDLESEPGVGTCFIVMLPKAPSRPLSETL